MKTLFEKIIDNELPSEKVYEDEHVVAFKDIYPKAPIHLLIVTRKPIARLQEMKQEDFYLLGHIAHAAQVLAKRYGLDQSGYRLLVNNGKHSGQVVDHLHFHLLGGAPLGDLG